MVEAENKVENDGTDAKVVQGSAGEMLVDAISELGRGCIRFVSKFKVYTLQSDPWSFVKIN